MAIKLFLQRKQKTLVFFLSLILVIVSVSLFVSMGIFAQNQVSSQSLEVSPPSQEVQADPGKTITVKSKVRNLSQAALPIKVHIEDFTASGEEGQVALEAAKGPYSLTNWSKITPASFTLKAGETQEIVAEVTIPKDNVAGGYYGSFVYGVTTPEQGGAASIGQEIASLFLVKISGAVKEQLFLDEFKAPAFLEFGPVPFSLKFTNKGNVHSKAFGLINVTDMFGNKVSDIVVTGSNVFPGASRIIKASLNKQFLLGRYTATAIMYYGSIKNDTLTSVTNFTVIPVRLLATVILIFFILYLLRKRLRKALKVLFG